MAQIKFFRGDRDLFFSGAEGAFNSESYADAVCFSNDTHEIIVNGVGYGMSEDLKGYLADGKILSGVEQDGLKVTLSFTNADPIEIDFSEEVATSSKNGLMSAEDKVKVDTMAAALVDSEGKVIEATKDHAGLMSAAHVALLLSLDGSGSGEGADAGILTRMAAAEGNIVNLQSDVTTLQGEMDAVEAAVEAIENTIGDWEENAKTIAEAVGGIDGRVTTLGETVDSIDGRVTTLEGQIQGLSGAMHFKGVVDSDPTAEGFVVSGYANGDVVLFGEKEYVFNGGAFVEFGDVSAEGERISALEEAVKGIQENTANADAIAALAERVTKNEGDITSVTTQAGENKTAIEELAERVKGLEDSTADADLINALAAKVGEGFSEENTVADAISALVARMDAVDTEETGSIAVLAGRVAALEDDKTCEEAIQGLADRIKAIEDDKTCEESIEDHEGRISVVEDQLTWHDVTAQA